MTSLERVTLFTLLVWTSFRERNERYPLKAVEDTDGAITSVNRSYQVDL